MKTFTFTTNATDGKWAKDLENGLRSTTGNAPTRHWATQRLTTSITIRGASTARNEAGKPCVQKEDQKAAAKSRPIQKATWTLCGKRIEKRPPETVKIGTQEKRMRESKPTGASQPVLLNPKHQRKESTQKMKYGRHQKANLNFALFGPAFGVHLTRRISYFKSWLCSDC